MAEAITSMKYPCTAVLPHSNQLGILMLHVCSTIVGTLLAKPSAYYVDIIDLCEMDGV